MNKSDIKKTGILIRKIVDYRIFALRKFDTRDEQSKKLTGSTFTTTRNCSH